MTGFTPRSLTDLAHEFPPQIERLSATGMKMFLRCTEQYRQRYILGSKKPPSLAMLTGRADHQAIEHSMRQKIETWTDLPVGEVVDRYVHVVETEVEEAGGINELEDRPDVTTWDMARTRGVDGVTKYHRTISPQVQPVEVEEEFSIEVPGLPVPVIGYVDLVAVASDLSGGGETIIDRKTSGRSVSKIAHDWRFQGRIYQLHRPVPHHWHVTVLSKRGVRAELQPPGQHVLEPPKDGGRAIAKQLAMIGLQIGSLYQRYGPDEPWPASGVTHPFACDYCGWRDDCWYWKEAL